VFPDALRPGPAHGLSPPAPITGDRYCFGAGIGALECIPADGRTATRRVRRRVLSGRESAPHPPGSPGQRGPVVERSAGGRSEWRRSIRGEDVLAGFVADPSSPRPHILLAPAAVRGHTVPDRLGDGLRASAKPRSVSGGCSRGRAGVRWKVKCAPVTPAAPDQPTLVPHSA
jgi:hypothetical protein